jgi:hypothetical protein
MAISGQQFINIGTQNQSIGSDSLYIAFNKIQNNFSDLFNNASSITNFVGSTGISAEITTANTVTLINTGVTKLIPGTGITLSGSNGNVIISVAGDGTGNIVAGVTSVGVTSNSLAVTNSPIVSSGNIAINLPTTGVTPGEYTAATVTVDEYGRVTSIANTIGSGTVTSVGISAGIGIAVSGGPITSSGVITLVNTGVTKLTAGAGIVLSGSNGAVTISAGLTRDVGTVTRVGISSNSLTIAGGSITTAGNIHVDIPDNLTVDGNISANNFRWNTFTNTFSVVGNLVSNRHTVLGSPANVVITGGTAGFVLSTDGAGNLTWTAQTGTAGTDVAAAGSNTQIQFNDSGVIGANTQLTYNKVTNVLNVGNIVANGSGLTNVNAANVTGTHSNLSVVGDSSLNGLVNINGNITANSNVSVTGAATITGSLTVVGVVKGDTATAGTANTQLATTEFVAGTIATESLLKANIASPTFTGTPRAPTASQLAPTGTQVATTQYVKDAVSTVTALFGTTNIPTGGIIMYTGVTAPSGWALCNGQNGTPDLRDKFVIGAGLNYAYGTTGGYANTVLPVHTHNATSTFTGYPMGTHSHNITDPGHNHSFRIGQGAGTLQPPLGGWNYVGTYPGSPFNLHNQPAATGIVITPGSAGTPGGAVNTAIEVTGSPTANTNIPPYYALCYIMKL